MQQLLTQDCIAVVNIANSCLAAHKFNKIVEWRSLVTKVANAINIMEKLNTILTIEGKRD